MTAVSAKGLFRATGKVSTDLESREEHDFYPTPHEVTRALLARELPAIEAAGPVSEPVRVWEPACGDGAMVGVMRAAGLRVIATDLVDRGCPEAETPVDFFHVTEAPARVLITNPPYMHINARDGKGRWLTHARDLGLDYIALFLNYDWPAAAGLSGVLARHPISRVYVCRWKVDFTGKGSPPQRNAWFIWDRAHRGETVFRYLDRQDDRQAGLFPEAAA